MNWCLLILPALFLLGGCVTPIPQMSDPLAELGLSRPTAPQDLASLQGRRVAVLLSRNTRELIQYFDTRKKEGNTTPAALFTTRAIDQLTAEALSPNSLLAQPARILKSHFQGLEIVQNLDEAATRGYAHAVTLDLQKEVVSRMGGPFSPAPMRITWQTTFIFVRTAQPRQMLGEIRSVQSAECGEGGSTVYVESMVRCDNQTRDRALEQLQARLQQDLDSSPR
jgi:hypothetical protein